MRFVPALGRNAQRPRVKQTRTSAIFPYPPPRLSLSALLSSLVWPLSNAQEISLSFNTNVRVRTKKTEQRTGLLRTIAHVSSLQVWLLLETNHLPSRHEGNPQPCAPQRKSFFICGLAKLGEEVVRTSTRSGERTVTHVGSVSGRDDAASPRRSVLPDRVLVVLDLKIHCNSNARITRFVPRLVFLTLRSAKHHQK